MKSGSCRLCTSRAGIEALDLLLELNLQTSSSAPLLQDAFAIAVNFNRTLYDAIYVALALATNHMSVTADERLANSLAGRFPIRWLGAL